MNRLVSFSILSAVAIGLSSAQAQQQAPNAPWYLGVKAGMIFTDGSLDADRGDLVGLEVGRQFGNNWTVELEAWKDTTQFDDGADKDQQGFQINFVQFNRVPLWDPYFLIGVGAAEYDFRQRSETDLTVSVAIGGVWDLSEQGGVQLKADARYRYSLYSDDSPAGIEKGEPIFSVGLMIPLWVGNRR